MRTYDDLCEWLLSLHPDIQSETLDFEVRSVSSFLQLLSLSVSRSLTLSFFSLPPSMFSFVCASSKLGQPALQGKNRLLWWAPPNVPVLGTAVTAGVD